MTDDGLERRLRDILRSRQLSVDPSPDALERIHAGALRRHRRRMATSATAAAVVVLACGTAAGVALRPGPGGPDHTVAATIVSSVAATSASASSLSPSPTPPSTPTLKPSPLASQPDTAPDAGTVSRFNPVSVSAVSAATYWVLGYQTTATSDETTIKAELLHTTNGGTSFTSVGQPPFVLAKEPISWPAGTALVSDVRFSNTNDGWAYGPSLYRTIDGGTTWSKVTDIPGGVVDLVAANGAAWAVVDLSNKTTAGTASTGTGEGWALYSTTYGDKAQHWTRVPLPIDLGTTTPSIADQDGTVTLLTSGPLRDSYRGHVLIAPPGKPFTDHEGPCSQDLGGFLSNSKMAIWAVCPTGMTAGIFVSTNRGVTWTPRSGPDSVPNPDAAIGAIDDQHAIVMDYATGTLLRLGRSGPAQPVASTKDLTGAAFIGFTNPSVGFTILSGGTAGNTLLRTTDGGLHWSLVKLAP